MYYFVNTHRTYYPRHDESLLHGGECGRGLGRDAPARLADDPRRWDGCKHERDFLILPEAIEQAKPRKTKPGPAASTATAARQHR